MAQVECNDAFNHSTSKSMITQGIATPYVTD